MFGYVFIWLKYIFRIKFKIPILDLMLLSKHSGQFEVLYYNSGSNYCIATTYVCINFSFLPFTVNSGMKSTLSSCFITLCIHLVISCSNYYITTTYLFIEFSFLPFTVNSGLKSALSTCFIALCLLLVISCSNYYITTTYLFIEFSFLPFTVNSRMKSALSTCFIALCLLLVIHNNVRAATHIYYQYIACCRRIGCLWNRSIRNQCRLQMNGDKVSCYCSYPNGKPNRRNYFGHD